MKEKDRKDSALVTEVGAQGNPHLEKMKQALLAGHKAHRLSKANHNLNLREHRTAMIENKKPIYATDKNGNVKQLFRAGWYISVEEQAMVDEILANPTTKKLNEDIWAHMEAGGLEVEKAAGSVSDVRVVT